jgi:hypothetical protein
MIELAILIAICLIVFGAVTALAVAFPKPLARRRFDQQTPIKLRIIGGVRWCAFGRMPWTVTWPLAAIQLMDKGIRIGPNGRFLGVLVPSWEFEWSEVLEVADAPRFLRMQIRGNMCALVFFAPRSGKRTELLDAVHLAGGSHGA